MEERLIHLQKMMQYGNALKTKRIAEALLEDEPGLAEAHYALGIVYEQHLHDYSRAIECYKLAVHFEPKYAYAWYGLLRAYYCISDHENLAKAATQALEYPNVYKAYVYKHLGLSHEEQLHLKRAMKQYELARLYAMNDNDMAAFKRDYDRAKSKSEIKRD